MSSEPQYRPTAAKDHVCGPDCQCGCAAGRTIQFDRGIDARLIAGTYTKADVEHLAESNELLAKDHDERTLVVYVEPERVEALLEALDHIVSVTPHGAGNDHPDDTFCARCIADAALAADEENYGR